LRRILENGLDIKVVHHIVNEQSGKLALCLEIILLLILVVFKLEESQLLKWKLLLQP
jgi:hypothetical protein